MVTITFQCASMLELRNEMRNFLGLDVETGPQQAPAQVQETHPATNAAASSAPAAAETSLDQGAYSTQAQPEKKPRTRRTKEQIAADNLAKANGTAAPKADDVFANVAEGPQKTTTEVATKIAEAAPVAAPAGNTKEAVHQALQNVNVHCGLPKAREILTKFKVNRISEIKEDQYKAFVEECNAATMMA